MEKEITLGPIHVSSLPGILQAMDREFVARAIYSCGAHHGADRHDHWASLKDPISKSIYSVTRRLDDQQLVEFPRRNSRQESTPYSFRNSTMVYILYLEAIRSGSVLVDMHQRLRRVKIQLKLILALESEAEASTGPGLHYCRIRCSGVTWIIKGSLHTHTRPINC